jgi:hypothetical protein
MNEKNQDEILEDYMAQYESLSRTLNQVISIKVYDGSMQSGKGSAYKGCIVRFKDLNKNVKDPKAWEATLNSKGQGEIKVTFLAHMMANAGTTLEVVKVENGKETVIHEQTFKLKLPNNKWILDLPKKDQIADAGGFAGAYRITDSSPSVAEQVNATISYDDNLNMTISVPGCSGKVVIYEEDYDDVSFSGFTITIPAEANAINDMKNHEYFTCSGNLGGKSSYSYTVTSHRHGRVEGKYDRTIYFKEVKAYATLLPQGYWIDFDYTYDLKETSTEYGYDTGMDQYYGVHNEDVTKHSERTDIKGSWNFEK